MFRPQLLFDTVIAAAAFWFLLRAARHSARHLSGWRRRVTLLALGSALALILAGLTLVIHADLPLPATPAAALVALSFLTTLFSIYLGCLRLSYRAALRFQPSRRRLWKTLAGAAAAVPVTALGFGILQRSRIRLIEQDLSFATLPQDLDGFRVALISDIHLGPFLDRRQLARAIAMLNECRPHLAVVAGDLITRRTDPLEDCLIELRALRADAGVFGCLGNHERYSRLEDDTTLRASQLGIRFLRQAAVRLPWGRSRIQLSGVDYQQFRRPYLTGAEALLDPQAFNILLSHNPDVFPVAADKGFDLTLAGHTHGGQVNIEILDQNLNPARFFTPFIYGRYLLGRAALYVTRGLGTVGLPVRLGAPPEVAVLRLRNS